MNQSVVEKDKKIYEGCKLILTKYPELRNPILQKQRLWKYLEEFCGVKDSITKEKFTSKETPNLESVIRLYRLVQKTPGNEHLRADIESQQAAAELSNQHRITLKRKPTPEEEAKQFSEVYLR